MRPSRRLVVAVALGMVMSLPLPALGDHGETDIISPDGTQDTDRWGERTDVAHLTDDDGDSVIGDTHDKRDLVVAVFNHDTPNHTDVGRAYALDGGTLAGDPNDDADSPTELFQMDIPSGDAQDGAQFGFFVAVPGDVTGSGEDDIVAGAPGLDVGKAWLFDGADGSLVRELENPDGQSGQRFGARIGVAGDQDGDGHNDLVIGAPDTDVDVDDDGTKETDVGRAYVVSPKDGDNDGLGDHLFTIEHPDGQAGADFGKHVQGVGDLGSMTAAGDPPDDPEASEDGKTDLFINAFQHKVDGFERGRSYVISAGDDFDDDDVLDEQELLTRIDNPEPQPHANSDPDQGPAWFGIQEVKPLAPGDVTGKDEDGNDVGEPDGTPDLFGGAFRQDVWDNSHQDGGDSCDDPNHSKCNENQGKAWVFDGARSIEEQDVAASDSGHGVAAYQLNDPNKDSAGGSFGWGGDITQFNGGGSGINDLYIGQIPHPHGDDPPGGNGGTYVFDGQDAEFSARDNESDGVNNAEDADDLHHLELPDACQQEQETGNRQPALGWSSSVLEDVDGDDKPDYAAGAPWTDIDGTQDAGIVMFFGSDSSQDIDDC